MNHKCIANTTEKLIRLDLSEKKPSDCPDFLKPIKFRPIFTPILYDGAFHRIQPFFNSSWLYQFMIEKQFIFRPNINIEYVFILDGKKCTVYANSDENSWQLKLVDQNGKILGRIPSTSFIDPNKDNTYKRLYFRAYEKLTA